MHRYDIHVHTMETSRCGHIAAADLVKTYHDFGYAGICVTDHMHSAFAGARGDDEDWQQCVTRFLVGYQEAKRAGDAVGLDVILGVEFRFTDNDSDYLVYGVDEAWLRQNPYPCRMDAASFFRTHGDSVLIIHAHPYRNCDVVFTDCIHGLEIANCNVRHDSRNHLALELARRHPALYRLCGSDAHRPGDEGRAAVEFETRIEDSFALRAAIESRRYRLSCPDYASIIEQGEAIGTGTPCGGEFGAQ